MDTRLQNDLVDVGERPDQPHGSADRGDAVVDGAEDSTLVRRVYGSLDLDVVVDTVADVVGHRFHVRGRVGCGDDDADPCTTTTSDDRGETGGHVRVGCLSGGGRARSRSC